MWGFRDSGVTVYKTFSMGGCFRLLLFLLIVAVVIGMGAR
jgi:hypothetical protein